MVAYFCRLSAYPAACDHAYPVPVLSLMRMGLHHGLYFDSPHSLAQLDAYLRARWINLTLTHSRFTLRDSHFKFMCLGCA